MGLADSASLYTVRRDQLLTVPGAPGTFVDRQGDASRGVPYTLNVGAARRLALAAVTTPGLGTLYTSTAPRQSVVTRMSFANTAAVATTIQVQIVPSGGAGVDIIPTQALPGNARVDYDIPIPLEAGDAIAAAAGAAGVNGLLVGTYTGAA